MRTTLGPLDASGRVPAQQQTRVASFLISAHGAEARLLAGALSSSVLTLVPGVVQVGLQTQLCREAEVLTLLQGATRWQPDPMLLWLLPRWELAWLPQPVAGIGIDQSLAFDAAAFGFALHTAIRPAVLLPREATPTDGFAAALRQIELEGSRTVQPQLRFLKSPALAALRPAISQAVERRHAQLRTLWAEMLAGIGIAIAS